MASGNSVGGQFFFRGDEAGRFAGGHGSSDLACRFPCGRCGVTRLGNAECLLSMDQIFVRVFTASRCAGEARGVFLIGMANAGCLNCDFPGWIRMEGPVGFFA